jgi:hypothetical protein
MRRRRRPGHSKAGDASGTTGIKASVRGHSVYFAPAQQSAISRVTEFPSQETE